MFVHYGIFYHSINTVECFQPIKAYFCECGGEKMTNLGRKKKHTKSYMLNRDCVCTKVAEGLTVVGVVVSSYDWDDHAPWTTFKPYKRDTVVLNPEVSTWCCKASRVFT